MSVIASSLAISQTTSTDAAGTPPSDANGSGATRVHSTTPSGSGSPDAIPSVNGSDENPGSPTGVATGLAIGDASCAESARVNIVPDAAAPSTNVRRFTDAVFIGRSDRRRSAFWSNRSRMILRTAC